jgi:hypothetical protein
MIVNKTKIYQVIYLAGGNANVKNGAAVIAKSYDNARDIFTAAKIPHDRITSIGEIAASYLVEDVPVVEKVKFVDATDPETEIKKSKGKSK